MNLTTFFRLRKPEGTDPVNVEDFNDNFDLIDTELNKRPEKTGNASDMVTTFTQASSRANLTPGEKLSVSFGKIMKFFADLKSVAFTGNYADLSGLPTIPSGAAASQAVANNCTTTAAGSVLDARQGKVLMDKANQISSDLGKVRVYVGSDGKLHFVNSGGADSVLPFSRMASGQEAVGTPGRTITINCGFRPNRVFTYNTTRYTTYLYDVRMPVVMHGYINGNWRPMSDYEDTYFAVSDTGFSFAASYAYASDTILWFAAE